MSVTIRCGTPAVRATSAARACASSAVAAVTSANSQPPPSGSSGRPLHHAGDPLVEALAGDQRVLQQGGYGVRRVGHRRVAEHGQRAERSVLDQAHGRVEDHAQGALGADEEPVEPAAVLRAAGARRSSPRPGGRSGRTRCGRRSRCWSTRACRSSVVESSAAIVLEPLFEWRTTTSRRRAAPSAPRRCRRCGRSRAPASRRRCCRSSRRSCSGCGSTGRGRTAGPRAAASFCRPACTTPGCTSAVRASRSSSSTWLRCRLVSTTIPAPTALPAMEVPAPRIVSGTPDSRPTSRAAATSSVSAGGRPPAAGSGRGWRRWSRGTAPVPSRRRR